MIEEQIERELASTMKSKPDPKKRIIKSAATLIAKKGFSAVSVREITKSAKVNLAMVSYYFDGKTGILKEIISQFFEAYEKAIEDSLSKRMSLEKRITCFVKNLVSYIKDHKDIFKVAYYELPYDTPEIVEFRGQRIQQIRKVLWGHLFPEREIDNQIAPHLPIVGPAILSMVFSNFILEPVIKVAFDVEFDDAFYDSYTANISELILKGLPRFIEDLR